MFFLESIIITIFIIIFLGSQISLAIFGLHYSYLIIKYLKIKKRKGNDDNNYTINNDLNPKIDYPFVTIQFPIYNEKNVILDILRSLPNLKYPKSKLEIQILDDSTDETSYLIINELERNIQLHQINIKHIQRENRDNYKAGALNNGLKLSKGEFIAIFDADFTIPKNFLLNTVPLFYNNKKLGCIQTRWGHKNKNESNFTQAIALGIDGHFIIEQNVRNKLGVMNFNGTCGIWRKDCIIDAGNWDGTVLSEDLDLSYRAHLKGWDFEYKEEIVCKGEIPSISGYKQQQYRWAKGTSQALRKNIGSIYKSKIFSKEQKIESTFHHTSYFIQLLMLLGILSSILLIKYQRFEILQLGFLFTFIFILAPTMYLIAGMHLNYPIISNLKLILYLSLIGIGISWHTGKAVVSGLIFNKGEFNRTPKKGSNKFNSYFSNKVFINIGEIFILILICFGLIISIENHYFATIPTLIYSLIGFGYVLYLEIKESIGILKLKSLYSKELNKNIN